MFLFPFFSLHWIIRNALGSTSCDLLWSIQNELLKNNKYIYILQSLMLNTYEPSFIEAVPSVPLVDEPYSDLVNISFLWNYVPSAFHGIITLWLSKWWKEQKIERKRTQFFHCRASPRILRNEIKDCPKKKKWYLF